MVNQNIIQNIEEAVSLFLSFCLLRTCIYKLHFLKPPKNDSGLVERGVICYEPTHTKRNKKEIQINFRSVTSLAIVYFQTCCICRMLGNDDESPFRIITTQSLSANPLLKLTVTCLAPWKLTPLATLRRVLLQ